MSSWRNEYLSALRVRDSQEQATKAIYDAYTHLADRAAALSAPPSVSSAEKPSTPLSKPSPGTPASAQVRQDLLAAQRSRGELQTRLDTAVAELERLRLRSKAEAQRIGELTAERGVLVTKLRDKDEELRGKAKLLEEVHDENLSLTIELNMAEATKKKLEEENQELVDRWMARKGLEAEEMNRAGKFS